MRKPAFTTLITLTLPWILGTPIANADNSTQTCPRGLLYLENECRAVNYMSIDYTIRMNEKAESFLQELKTQQLNVVTAESLTSGMIISTLVNVPLYGAYTYGGFSTYDSDAKRKMIGVTKGDVYTETTARQMAEGALTNSRAMVAIAVTGHAGPVDKNRLEDLGIVDTAVSIRISSVSQKNDAQKAVIAFHTQHRRMKFCDGDGLPMTHTVCKQYRSEAQADANGYVSDSILSLTRKLIRQNVVIEVLESAREYLQQSACDNDHNKGICNLKFMCEEGYDGCYTEYGEPSWVIEKYTLACEK